ncbi:efflux ABC transporter permease protein [Clostridium sp. CAG:354]|jgi:putative ABC transport system permease protein|nr:FtsX-like permease family protein [Clostridium sp.]MEE0269199.1 FtsX-like permease family protein [Clostridia bacterium]CDE10079.1 efflux ABC transporter permease protein [Clostridium sp. CAG:354]
MLFKLSIKNMRKTIKDFAIYVLTLVLGVAIFYMFNSLDSQEAMMQVSSSTRELIKLMITMLGFVSVFVAVILGLLIVYANNFLINRRKKEFGTYMMLGMSKGQISRILLIETIFVGIISLIVGLVIGVFASQFMSVLVGKLFAADMSKFEFVFSKDACIKTCIYFAVMYIAVMIFNTFTISRYKLINLLNASKKNEQIKIKNLWVCILVFIIGVVILGYAYYKVTGGVNELSTADTILPIILMGIVGTILVFWSVSGFILKLVQLRKNIYLKDVNMFVLRQLHNKINTTVVSMSIICLMLFMTITILSSALSLNNTMRKDLEDTTPVDLNLYKTANLPENEKMSKAQIEDSRKTMIQTLEDNGFDMTKLKDVVEIPIYATNELTWRDTLSPVYDEVKQQFPNLLYETAEEIVKVSDYNKIARLYGNIEYQLKDDEYIILCDFDNMKNLRNKALKADSTITIAGKEYKSKYDECQNGYIYMAGSHINNGIVLVPDSCNLTEDMKEETFLAANYNATTEEEKEEIEKICTGETETEFSKNLNEKDITIDGMTKIAIIESSLGVSTIVLFIAIYLGIIFLIASSAILALKQLTESSDNKQRYAILRKIGADEKMIKGALFKQIGIFFLMPLILAIIHSIFGIQFVMTMMSVLADAKELLPSAIATAVIIGVIYGAYFMATYLGSKNIIKEAE